MYMKRLIILIANIFLGVFLLYSQANDARSFSGIVNDDGIRVREQPSLEGAIVGRLNRGMTVTVLGRSKDRMFLEGYDSFWLKIRWANTDGWAYGAYINLVNSQYDSLPVLSTLKASADVDLNYSRDFYNEYVEPEDELLQKEKETLELQSTRFSTTTIQEYYNSIVCAFNRHQNLRPFFMNTQTYGIAETSRFHYVNASVLCDYIQSSYVDNITISPLIAKSENSASFVLSEFKKASVFSGVQVRAMSINIKKIAEVDFIPLKGKTIIDWIGVSPYSAVDFIEQNWGDANYFNSFMTSGTLDTRYTPLLEAILNSD